MPKQKGLVKAASMMAVLAALGTMLALWTPETPTALALAAEPALQQKAGSFGSELSWDARVLMGFLCLPILLVVGWVWRRKRARQPYGGRPAAAVPQIVRHRIISGRTT